MKNLKSFDTFSTSITEGYYDIDRAGWDKDKVHLATSKTLKGRGIEVPFEIGTVVTRIDDPNFAAGYNKTPGQIIDIFHNNSGDILYGVRFFNENGTTSLGKHSPEEIEALEEVPSYVTGNEKFMSK